MERFWWTFLEEMPYLIFLNDLLLKNIAYIGYLKHFIFVCVCVCFCMSLSWSSSSPEAFRKYLFCMVLNLISGDKQTNKETKEIIVNYLS